jgi:hypothetical protein
MGTTLSLPLETIVEVEEPEDSMALDASVPTPYFTPQIFEDEFIRFFPSAVQINEPIQAPATPRPPYITKFPDVSELHYYSDESE